MLAPMLDRARCWLETSEGLRILVRDRGLMLGRRKECDVVLLDRRASSQHCVITPTVRGVEVLALGKNPTNVNGETVRQRTLLRGGDRLEVPGGTYTVVLDEGLGFTDRAWVLQGPGGAWGIRQLPFTVGGGDDDHLRVDGWPEASLTFHLVSGTLAVELGCELSMSRIPLPEGAVETVVPGDRFERDGVIFKVESEGAGTQAATVLADGLGLPNRVRFQFLPSGGRLDMGFEGRPNVLLELSELRARLVAALLDPPGSYESGDYVPDEVLLPAIWSARAERGRTDLNILIHRTRKVLLKGGVNPSAILARAKQGGSTSFRIARGCSVTIE